MPEDRVTELTQRVVSILEIQTQKIIMKLLYFVTTPKGLTVDEIPGDLLFVAHVKIKHPKVIRFLFTNNQQR